MLPNFKPGQIVFARKTRNLSVNDVIVLKTDDNSQIIKRISKIQDIILKNLTLTAFWEKFFLRFKALNLNT